jgi:hypothetical protein
VADHDHVRFDANLLYAGSLLHDLGLLARFEGRCFEEDGATAAAELAADEGWPDEGREALAEAIRLHVAVEVALEDGPEAYFLWQATGLDVTGYWHAELAPQVVDEVVRRLPGARFQPRLHGAIAEQAARKANPNCWAARATTGGIAERIAAAPLAS